MRIALFLLGSFFNAAAASVVRLPASVPAKAAPHAEKPAAPAPGPVTAPAVVPPSKKIPPPPATYPEAKYRMRPIDAEFAAVVRKNAVDEWLRSPQPWSCREGKIYNEHAVAAEWYRSRKSDHPTEYEQFVKDREGDLRQKIGLAWDRGEFLTVSFYYDGYRLDHPGALESCSAKTKMYSAQAFVAYARAGRMPEANEVFAAMDKCDKAGAAKWVMFANSAGDDFLQKWESNQYTEAGNRLRDALTYSGNHERFLDLIPKAEKQDKDFCQVYDWKYKVVQDLEEPSYRKRWQSAMETIEKAGPQAAFAVPHLIERLKEDQPFDEDIITALTAIGPQASLPHLENFLRTYSSPAAKLLAAKAYGRMGPLKGTHSPDFLADLLAAERKKVPEDWDYRRELVTAIGRMGGDAKGKLPLLMQEAELDPKADVVQAMGDIGPEAIPDLVLYLTGDDARRRLLAAKALGQMGEAAAPAVKDIVDALRATRVMDEMRHPLLETLAQIKKDTPDVLGAIGKVLRSGTNDDKVAALRALEKLGPDAVPLILPFLSDEESDAVHAVQALRGKGEASAVSVPQLLALLKTAEKKGTREGQELAAAVLEVLGDMPTTGKSHIPLLLEKLKTGLAREREAAVGSLVKLRDSSVPRLLSQLREDHIGVPLVLETLKRIRTDSPEVRNALIPLLKNEVLGDRAALALVEAGGASLREVTARLEGRDPLEFRSAVKGMELAGKEKVLLDILIDRLKKEPDETIQLRLLEPISTSRMTSEQRAALASEGQRLPGPSKVKDKVHSLTSIFLEFKHSGGVSR